MEGNVLSLPESFKTADGGGGRRGSRGLKNKLPQWLVLCTVLANEREHAEITNLCRATDVFENSSNATPAELHEIQLWSCHFGSQRKRDRQSQKEFYCFVLDRCCLLREPVRLKREQFQGRQLQRVVRPFLYKLLCEKLGRHLMACPSGGNLLPGLKRERGWLRDRVVAAGPEVPGHFVSDTGSGHAESVDTGDHDCGHAHSGIPCPVSSGSSKPAGGSADSAEEVPEERAKAARGVAGAKARRSRSIVRLSPFQAIQTLKTFLSS